MPDAKLWGGREAATLRSVRAYLGHSQAQCAKALCELGATVGQGAVSGWETGKHVPNPDALTAIERYCRSTAEVPRAVPAPIGGDPFDRLIGTITGEPAKSDRQAAFVDAVITRLSSGSPMSEQDVRAIELILPLLGLGGETGPST
jgi:transcriptional regulator with XRE-family HTH domain